MEGEDGDVSSQHLELEKRSQVGAMGIRGKSDGGGNMNHWCDQFVPRPLQIEFARELHWFAWKGRKSSKDPSPESGKFKDEGLQLSDELSAAKIECGSVAAQLVEVNVLKQQM